MVKIDVTIARVRNQNKSVQIFAANKIENETLIELRQIASNWLSFRRKTR